MPRAYTSLRIPMKVVSDSDLIPVTCSEVKRSFSERSDAGVLMVLEVTGIGQLEFGFLFIFSCLLSHK